MILNQKSINELTELPNIGGVLASKLKRIKISTPEILFENGSIRAFIKLKEIDKSACYSTLCALEGAIQGVRWHDLEQERKQELKEFFELTKR